MLSLLGVCMDETAPCQPGKTEEPKPSPKPEVKSGKQDSFELVLNDRATKERLARTARGERE